MNSTRPLVIAVGLIFGGRAARDKTRIANKAAFRP
jgi:hypothetical protein